MKFIRYNENTKEEFEIVNREITLNNKIYTIIIDNEKYDISISLTCINENKDICDMIDRYRYKLEAKDYYYNVYPHKPKYEYRIDGE